MQSKFYRFPAATSDDDVIPAATMSDCDNEDDVFIDIEGDKDVDDTDDVIKNRQTVDHHDSHHGAIFSLALFASTALPSDSSPICMTLLKHMQRPWTPDPASPVSTSGSASPINSISDASFSSNCSTMMSGLLKPRNIAPQNSTYSQQLLPDVVQLPVGRRSPVKRTGFLIDEILSPAFGVRHSAAAQTTSPSKTSMQFDDRIGNETKLCSALKSVFESVPSCRDRYDPDRKVKSTSPSLCARPSSITAQTRCNSIAANNSQKARSPAKAISAAAVSRPIDTKIGIKHVPVTTKTEISSGSTSPTHAPALGSTSRSTQAVGAQFPLPAWVYCTRYSDRPSSGPRSRKSNKRQRTDGSLTSAALTSTGGANGCGQSPSSSSSSVTSSSTPDDKRPRTAFNSEQLAILRREFDDNRYLTEDRRRRLADALNLHESQIKIWFQNKRAKLKKASGAPNPLALELAAQGLYNHSTTTTTSSKSSSGKSPLECSS